MTKPIDTFSRYVFVDCQTLTPVMHCHQDDMLDEQDGIVKADRISVNDMSINGWDELSMWIR